MNKDLGEQEFDNCLELLQRGMIAIRMAARAGDCGACEQISDALHNLPDLLRRGDAMGWSVEKFLQLFLEPLASTNPALAGWPEILAQPEDHGST
jgi:hypothetical protein